MDLPLRSPTCRARRQGSGATGGASLALLVLGLLVPGASWVAASPTAGPAQGPSRGTGPAERDDPLGKLRTYLERNPWHESAFERLVQVALDEDLLGLLEQELRARVGSHPDDAAARVLLARMRARGHAYGEALALVAELDPPQPAQRLHEGRWLSRVDRVPDACDRLLEAAELAGTDPLLPERALEEALVLALRLGDAERTLRAADGLLALAPEDLEQHLHVASLLATGGRLAEAREHTRGALPLAQGRPELELRAWVQLAGLEERSGRRVEALDAVEQALALLGPDHWQRSGLCERRLVLARATGRLPELLESCAAEAAARPGDGELRREWARVLVEIGRGSEALTVLEEARAHLPEHVGVGRDLASTLNDAGRWEEAVALLQDLAARAPRSQRLHLEAGLLLAAHGEPEAAARQWDLELAGAPEDLELRLELAGLHAAYGSPQRADALLLEALEQRPGDLRPARALAARWESAGPSSRVTHLLEDLQRRADRRGDAHALEELAQEWFAREDELHGMRALELALQHTDDARSLLLALVLRLDPRRDGARMIELRQRLVELAPDVPSRAAAMVDLVEDLAEGRRERSWLANHRGPRQQDPSQAVPWLLLAMVQDLVGEEEQALEQLQACQGAPQLQGYVEIWLLCRHGHHGRAAVVAEALVAGASDVRERRDLWQQAARLHRQAGQVDQALRCEEQLLASVPDSSVVLTEMAEQRRNDPLGAVQLLKRALRLNPEDEETRLALARTYLRLDREADALEALLPGLRARDAHVRRQSRDVLLARRERLAVVPLEHDPDGKVVDSTDTLLWDLDELRRVLDRVPQRWELGVLAVHQARAEQDHDRAATLLTELLQRRPEHPALLDLQEDLRGLTPYLDPLDPPWVALPDGPLREQLRLADTLLVRGDLVGARRLLREVEDPVLVTNTWMHRGQGFEALRALRGAAGLLGSAERAVREATVLERSGHRERAARALEEALEATNGVAWGLRMRAARMACEHPGPRARAAFGRLFEGLDRSRVGTWTYWTDEGPYAQRVRELAELADARGLGREFLAQGRQSLRTWPNDPALLRAVLERTDARDVRNARSLLDAAAEATTPDGWSPRRWRGLLLDLRTAFENRGATDTSTDTGTAEES